MYWDLLKVDLFLRQMRSNKRLVSFATITGLLTHPGMYFTLVCLFLLPEVVRTGQLLNKIISTCKEIIMFVY